ncbi:DUF2922 domain-containing protein [Metabacillus herbersteinensis]|uniref:DUF2922 domain-containing protein n=1 Tax=Metabacillus herbersteinensis TaxID=283816 RepID=A0ABV6GDG3_9BACI
MAKTLELHFVNTGGKTVKLTVESPKEPIDSVAIGTAMDEILAANLFMSADGGDFISKKGARVVERNVTDIELV